MTEPAPQIVKSYLAELERALGGVPDEVGREILAGITEELSGLDTAAAAERIELLGDPTFIAAEACTEAGAEPQASDTSMPEVPGDPRWYTVLASLLVALGGVVIPVLGWVFGIAMVWVSKTWRTWEKWVATLAPIVVAAIAVLIAWLIRQGVTAQEGMTSEGMTSEGMTSGSPPSPLMPTLFDVWWFGLLLVASLNVFVGIWLLSRARRSH